MLFSSVSHRCCVPFPDATLLCRRFSRCLSVSCLSADGDTSPSSRGRTDFLFVLSFAMLPEGTWGTCVAKIGIFC